MNEKGFEFLLPTKVLFGEGKAKETGKAVFRYGRSAMVVTTPWIEAQRDVFNKIINLIEAEGVRVVLYDEACANPTLTSIMKGIAIAKSEQVEVMVGLGGGSAMDTAKAIAVGVTHPGTPWDYLYFKETQPTEKTLPIITVTTTSGIGSHVTKVSVFTNEATETKSAICNPCIFPKTGIVDPELMYSMPAYLTAATGFDAFTHAFESYININSNKFIDTIALEAISAIAKNLPVAIAEPTNAEARRNMAYADTLAGITIANVGTTLPHAMGQPVSGHAPHVSHGEALALVYPQFMEFTCMSKKEKFAKVARIFEPSLAAASDENAAIASPDIIRKFLKRIGLDLSLKSLKVDISQLDRIISDCMDFPDMYVNPAVPGKEQLYEMFGKM